MEGITSTRRDVFGNEVVLTEERLRHILKRPEMKGQELRILETLESPVEVRRSIHDRNVWLFYRFFHRTPVGSKYLAVVVKVLSRRGFIITSYFTDRIKKGEIVWKA